MNAFIGSLKTDCKYIGDLVNEYADAKCQLSMLYDADPAHVEEQRQKGIAEADKLIANKVLEAIRTMLRKDRETGAFEYAEARKAYYTEQMICEILMALEQNAVNMGMEYDDCQKAMGGDLSKAAKKDWYLRHQGQGYGTVVFLGLIRSQMKLSKCFDRFIIAKLIDRKQVLRYTITNGGGHDD